jgi:NADH-quinone oxidoreductase subunit G
VWLDANHLEPRLSPFDPLAALDEIARLVPGYAVDRLNLLSGGDVESEPGYAPPAALSAPSPLAQIHEGLFSSGTLGEHSPTLLGIKQHQADRLVQIKVKA